MRCRAKRGPECVNIDRGDRVAGGVVTPSSQVTSFGQLLFGPVRAVGSSVTVSELSPSCEGVAGVLAESPQADTAKRDARDTENKR